MSVAPDMPQGSSGTELTQKEAQAAEYVLGTLSSEERDALETVRAGDPTIGIAIRDWERRLAPLSLMMSEAVPPTTVWDGIARRLRTARPHVEPAANDNRVEALSRQVRRWRAATVGSGLAAAGLALAIALGPWLSTASRSERYVAVVTSGDAPALIVSIDTARGTAQVRPVAAQTPAGKSLELWYVGGGRPPLSLGLLKDDASRIAIPSEAERGEGVFAVSIEPPGGSKTGQPTGRVVYQGKLIRE